jgi:hypothetical protein
LRDALVSGPKLSVMVLNFNEHRRRDVIDFR